MADEKKGIYTSIFIITVLGAAGIYWLFYTAKTAAPPLPATPMSVVFNTQYDGSVWQIKDWLKKHADEPSSLKVLHWGKVVDLNDGYLVHVKFEAKNKSGAYVVSDKVFKLDKSGTIVGMVDFKPKKP